MKTDTEIGQEIRDSVFGGNPYSQLARLREVTWASDVIEDYLTSQIDSTYEKIYSDDDLIKAKEIKQQSREINTQILNTLSKHYEK